MIEIGDNSKSKLSFADTQFEDIAKFFAGEAELNPSYTERQRRLHCIGYSIKKGATPKGYSPQAAEMAKTMTMKQLRDGCKLLLVEDKEFEEIVRALDKAEVI